MKSSESEPCVNPTFNFPLPRRPLRSQTCRTFAQILTQCAALQSPQLLLPKLGKEFEELICSPAAADSSACHATAVDFEQGQVSGDDAPYETMDFLFHSAEAREGFGSENQSGPIGRCEIDMTSFFSLEEVHHNNNLLETQSNITHLDADKVPFSCEGRVQISEVRKLDSAIEYERILEKVVDVKTNLTALAQDLAPPRIIMSKTTTDDDDVLTNEKNVCVADLEKIKKRRPLSKERKAKKKKKERIRRAEKNMKLGVKRVKLQPVVKAKKVIDCRHYINGRCQMGDKCKFSHEKTPLTKSMPCCHFARGCCMKGDDCPYDHQLSKYPCRKHATNPPCLRADCKFSHEADLKTPVENSDLNPKQQLNSHCGRIHKQFDSSLTSRSSKKIPDLQTPVAIPKGISMISFGGSSSSSKHDDKSPMPVVEESVVNLDQQATIHSLNRVEKINEVANYKVPMRPKGINFLSYGNTPLNASQFDGRPRDIGDSSFAVIGVDQSGSRPNNVNNTFPCTEGRENSFGGSKSSSIDLPKRSSCSSNPFSLFCSDNSAGTSSAKESPSSALKALDSTLAFAAKLDSKIKLGPQALIR